MKYCLFISMKHKRQTKQDQKNRSQTRQEEKRNDKIEMNKSNHLYDTNLKKMIRFSSY